MGEPGGFEGWAWVYNSPCSSSVNLPLRMLSLLSSVGLLSAEAGGVLEDLRMESKDSPRVKLNTRSKLLRISRFRVGLVGASPEDVGGEDAAADAAVLDAALLSLATEGRALNPAGLPPMGSSGSRLCFVRLNEGWE